MEEYIRRILGIAESIGSINEGVLHEATEYAPKTIRFSGITKDGELFELELRVGDKKNAYT